jgi:Rps23 Pro-64 3,4-dihydroxylase Tpa1-like proline 4-hydroxylase
MASVNVTTSPPAIQHDPAPAINHVKIRGRRLNLGELFACDLTSPNHIAEQRVAFCSNKPFEHIVIDGLFNEQLLSLIEEEFPATAASGWRHVSGRFESTYRSKSDADLGPAAQIYFNLVNSTSFVGYLSAITGIPDLITDHTLLGGGLHESRAGGRFAVHRDFNYHPKTMLANTLVLITYLNRNWRPEYGGALELWDGKLDQKVIEIAPVFGRSILFRNSDRSFHGHPTPLTPPPGRSRRSVCSYYYLNDLADYRRLNSRSSLFLDELRKQSSWMQAQHKLAEFHAMGVMNRVKCIARGLTPPLFWWGCQALSDVAHSTGLK